MRCCPQKKGSDYYSVIYYLCKKSEKLPIPILDRMFNWFRSFWYGSSQDWEAIQIDCDRKDGTPKTIHYETANYTRDPRSFHNVSRADLHLKTSLERQSDGKYKQVIIQKNDQKRERPLLKDVFKNGRLQVAYVSWNGMVDVLEGVVKIHEYCNKQDKCKKKHVWQAKDVEMKFLDAKTYRQEGFDLRMGWLDPRKKAKCHMTLPARKNTKKVTLSLLPRKPVAV